MTHSLITKPGQVQSPKNLGGNKTLSLFHCVAQTYIPATTTRTQVGIKESSKTTTLAASARALYQQPSSMMCQVY